MKECSFLLIDDDQISCSFLSIILKKAGYENHVIAYSGNEALNILDENSRLYDDNTKERIGIIITDLYMPEMDGIELCRRIRMDHSYDLIPIIMITASEEIDDLEKAFDAGVLDYINKPFIPVEVLTRIKSALRLKDEMEKRLDRESKLERFNKNLVDDLNVAVQLQRQMLPLPINTDKIKINGFYLPYTFLGGDLYYWCRLDKHRYGVVLLDVMGHGTVTSMICMYLRAIIPDVMKKNMNTEGFVRMLNAHMCDFNRQIDQNQYYCTLFYMIIDIDKHTIEYVNAGHPPAVRISDNKVDFLKEGCLPIGLFDTLVIESGQAAYQEETIIYLYSDGMLDVLRPQGLDKDYLADRFKNNRDTQKLSEDSIESLHKEIELITRQDDVSLVQINLFFEGSM